jgi:hypothetical protein
VGDILVYLFDIVADDTATPRVWGAEFVFIDDVRNLYLVPLDAVFGLQFVVESLLVDKGVLDSPCVGNERDKA